jgi:hypothetical protein
MVRRPGQIESSLKIMEGKMVNLLIFSATLGLAIIILNYCYQPTTNEATRILEKREYEIHAAFDPFVLIGECGPFYEVKIQLAKKRTNLRLSRNIFDIIQVGDSIEVSYKKGRIFNDVFSLFFLGKKATLTTTQGEG